MYLLCKNENKEREGEEKEKESKKVQTPHRTSADARHVKNIKIKITLTR